MDCIQNFFIFLIDKYNVQSYNKKHQQWCTSELNKKWLILSCNLIAK